MRLVQILTLAMLAACGGDVEVACPEDVPLGEADVGCFCDDWDFELHDNGEICTCGNYGFICDAPTDTSTTSTTGGCRRGVADTASGCG